MNRARLKDKNGYTVIVITEQSFKALERVWDFIFKQKILLEKRELNKQEAIKALSLGYCVKVVNDAWCEDEQELNLWKDYKGRMIVYEKGKPTDEYLPEEYLTPNVKYFLEGTIFEGEYVPF